MVPKPYRKLVLELAHGHFLGGHLGTEKTRERVLQRFYWPGLMKETENYCSSCPVCQKSAPMPHFCNPLVPLSIIEVTFERIEMDLVGPIIKSARGHQYILVKPGTKPPAIQKQFLSEIPLPSQKAISCF